MAKKFLTEIDLDNNKAINVANPTNDQDAATKKYVDDNAGGDHGMAALAPIEVSVSTAASTAAKVGTTSGGSYTPTAGDVLLVTFSASNTANNATLNVDGSGAKNIQTGGVNTSNISLAGTKVLMWYDGTRYQLFGSQRVSDTNTTYSEISEANIVNAASATAGTITGRRMEHYKNTNLIIDEDDMASDSATKMPSQQSVKAYVDTGLSGKQDVITGGASSIVSSNLTPERALVSSSSGKVIVSNVTDIELEYLDGVTSAIQTQLNAKAADTDVVKLTGNQTIAGIKTFSSFPATPSSAPTTNYQVANKKYVDDNVGGGGFTWNNVSGTTQSAAVNNGYIIGNGSKTTVTLPTTAAVGSVVRIAGKGAGGWRLAQNSGETIYFGESATTTGAGGYIESTKQYDSVEVVCITANNDWVVISSVGNLEVA